MTQKINLKTILQSNILKNNVNILLQLANNLDNCHKLKFFGLNSRRIIICFKKYYYIQKKKA